jgi:hypothetical protein
MMPDSIANRWMTIALILATLLVLLFGVFVWPTPYRYDKLHEDVQDVYTVRINRFTGRLQILTLYGWRSGPLETPTPAPTPTAISTPKFIPDTAPAGFIPDNPKTSAQSASIPPEKRNAKKYRKPHTASAVNPNKMPPLNLSQLGQQAWDEVNSEYSSNTPAANTSPTAPILAGHLEEMTGYDMFKGRIETKTGHTYRIPREGERQTAVIWIAPDELLISCKAKECLIEDQRTKQAVHAIKER